MPGLSLSSLGGSIVHQMFELHTLLKACSLTTKFLLQYQMFFLYIMCRSHIKGVTNMDKTTCSNELLSYLNVYFVHFTGSYIPFIGLIS